MIAQAAGVLLICAGLVPLVQSFIEFIRADGTPMPLASPQHRHAVPAWLPRLRPWMPAGQASPADGD